MKTLNVVKVRPNGGTYTEEIDVVDRDVVFKFNGKKYSPVYVEEVSYEDDGETESIQDQCGRVETRDFGANSSVIKLSGIVSEASGSVVRDSDVVQNLSHSVVKQMHRQVVDFESPVDSGEYLVKSITVVDSADIYSIKHSADNESYAFDFQMQLSQPSSE